MSQIAVKKTVQRSQVILPQEHFWKCYSPQHEFPLSTVCSIAVHGLVIGGLVLFAYLANLPQNLAESEPPRIDVAEIAGGGGTDGFGGPGVGASVPGKIVPFAKVADPSKQQITKPDDPANTKLEVPKTPDPLKPSDPPEKPTKPELDADAVFGAVISDARDEVAKAMNIEAKQLATTGVVGGSPGTGGGVGGGQGTGIGANKGPGSGNDPKGVLLSKRQKRELRWAINFALFGSEHIKQLRALQITLAIPTPTPGLFQVVDMSGPSPKFNLSDLKLHVNKVKWFNANKDSLANLAGTLKLPFAPKYVVILLPESVEQELADLEEKKSGGVPENLIQYTHFEIILRDDGSYGPVVKDQKLKPGAGVGQ